MKKALLALAILATLVAPASAATKYWDIDGAIPEAGGATPTGTWDTTTSNWTFSSTGVGVATTFTNTDDVFFSAGTTATGTFNVTIPTATVVAPTSATFQEGTVTLVTGGVSTRSMSTQTIVVENGAKLFTNAAFAITVPSAGGTLTLNGGTATIGNSNTGTGSSFLSSGTANTNMGIVLNGGGHVSANGGAGIVTIYTGLISGTGPLSVDGNGTFRLTTTPATYTGATIVNGTLQISTTADVLPDATDMTINSGGTFNVQANDTIGSLTGAGNITSAATRILTIGGATSPAAFSGAMSGNMSLVRSGTGTLTLSGTNTYTGSTSVNGGLLQMNSAAAVPSGTALTLGSGTLSNVTGGLKTFSGATTLNSATATLVENSAAENFTFSGNFTNSGGNRTLRGGNGVGTAAGVITLSGNVFLSEAAATGRTMTLSGLASSAPTFVVSGNIANAAAAGVGNGNITIGGTSAATSVTATLSGTNTHTGNTTLNTSSLLKIGSAGAFGASTFVIGGNGSFDNTTGGALVLATNMNQSGGSPTFVGTNDLTLGNVAIIGANRSVTVTANTLTINNLTEDVAGRNYTKSGAGKLVVIGNTSNTGLTTISNGILQVGNGGATGTLSTSSAIVNNANLTFNRSNAATQGTDFSNGISGTGSLTQAGSGTTTLNAANTYSGDTRSAAGTLNVAHSSAMQNSTLDMNGADAGAVTFDSSISATTVGGLIGSRNLTLENTSSAAVNLSAGNNNSNGTYSGILSGIGSLTKVGTGIMTLTGASTYGTVATTGTTVNAGKLLVNNTTGSGTGVGDVLVTGGTLGGTGTISGSVTVTGGSLSPGASISQFNIGGTLNMSGGTFDYELDSNTLTADLNNVAGNLLLSGGVALSATDLGSALLAAGTKFTVINYAGTWNGGTFAGLPNMSTTTIGLNTYRIRYNDLNGGVNFGGGAFGNGTGHVTLTAVPEASTFLILGLGGIFAFAAVRMGQRLGINVLKV